jgi:outer membrane protein assembly factor BamA
MPILMYGSDVGVGYGAKLFLLNHLRRNESLDVVLFNSTKGERWFRLLLSNPDFERRQGKTYPLSVDLLGDYNRRINSSFFGVGSMSAYDDEESYRREASEIRLTVGRGFSTTVVGQVALQYRSNRHSDFESDSRLQLLPPELNAARASYMSVRFDLRHDTRDSFVNPTRGLVIRGEAELAPRFGPNEFSYGRYAVWLHRYSVLRGPRTVLALRLGVEGLVGSELPVQTLLSLGGGSTLRGFSQDRYLDKGRGLLNAEVRFPIYGWLGGVAGVDTGRVWTSLSEASFRGWAVSHVVGLRAYLETYVVRLDMGFGDETTGVYFNAGHVH